MPVLYGSNLHYCGRAPDLLPMAAQAEVMSAGKRARQLLHSDTCPWIFGGTSVGCEAFATITKRRLSADQADVSHQNSAGGIPGPDPPPPSPRLMTLQRKDRKCEYFPQHPLRHSALRRAAPECRFLGLVHNQPSRESCSRSVETQAPLPIICHHAQAGRREMPWSGFDSTLAQPGAMLLSPPAPSFQLVAFRKETP